MHYELSKVLSKFSEKVGTKVDKSVVYDYLKTLINQEAAVSRY